MAIIKTKKDFYEETDHRLLNTSQLRLFDILNDTETKTKFLNMFNSYRVNEGIRNAILYEYYEVGNNEWWDDISFKFYNTPYLWWVIPMVNEFTNPFESLMEGENIKILKPKFIYNVLKDIRNIGSI